MDITPYRQNDPLWANRRLGTGNVTIGSHGCYITCLAMLTGLTPPEVNDRAVYTDKDLVVADKTAKVLGLDFNDDRSRAIKYPTIAEVVMPKGQHFVVVDANGLQYDPLTGSTTRKYTIKSWRNISPKAQAIVAGMTLDNARGILYGLDPESPTLEADSLRLQQLALAGKQAEETKLLRFYARVGEARRILDESDN